MKTVLVVEGRGHDSAALQALLLDHGYAVNQVSGKSLQVSEVSQDSKHQDGNVHESPPLATFRSSLDGKLYAVAPAAVDTFEVIEPPQGVEQHFRGIYEKGPLGIFRTSLDGKLLSINPAGARMLKFDSPREMIETVNRTSIAEACYLDSSHRQEILAEILRSKDWQVYEEQFRCKDGSVIDCHVHIRAVRDDDGRTLELEGFLEEISERKRVERALHFTQFAVDKTIDQAFWMDVQGRFVYVNDAACHQMGYSRQELLGMSVFDIDPDYSADFFNRTWQELKRHCSKTFERRHRARDGRIFPVEVRANYLVYEGREYVCFFASDISERKRKDQTLRFTQFAIDNSIDQAFWSGADGRFIYVNDAACRALGYSRKELLQMSVPEIAVSFSAETFAEHQRELKEKGYLTFEILHRAKDGRVYPVEIRVNSVVFDGKEYTCAFATDISERKRTQEALQLSQVMIDGASMGIFRGSEDARILAVNDYWARKLGYTPEELCSLTFFDLVPTLTPEFWREHRKKVTASGSNTFESVHRCKDGTEIPVEVTVNYHTYGDQVFSCSFAKDITERKRAEEARWESERKYRSIVEHAPFGITHSTKDGKLVSVNPALAAILKYDSAQELMETINRSSIQEVLFPKPSEREPLVEQILSGDSWTVFNNRLLCRDGTIVTCRVHSRRIMDEDGQARGFESYQENITDQVEAVQALQESEEKFRVLAETSPIAICLYRGESIIYANPATERLFGYSLDELLSMKFWDWAQEDCKELIRERGLARLRGKSEPSQYEARYVTKNGEERCILVSAGRMEYQGRPTGVASLIDISERKRTEELIRASLDEKEVLLREIHHRVKNNLQVVSSLLYLQAQKFSDPELQQGFLESQSRICSMALAHEQLYQSKNLAAVSVKSYLENLVGQLQQIFQAPEQKVDCRLAVEDVELDIEKVIPCGLLITELLSNAYKHAFVDGRKGHITVSLKCVDKGIVLTVADNGVGLPAEFDCRQTKTLGLQLVTALVNQLNSTLDLERSNGTLFRVRFVG